MKATQRVVVAVLAVAASLGMVAGTANAAVPNPTKPVKISAATVAKHKTAGDCWTVVNGNVYNLTKWISRHPGGQSPIKAMCGKDATAAFMGQHGSSGSPARTLAMYKIGSLAGATASTGKPSLASDPAGAIGGKPKPGKYTEMDDDDDDD